MPPKKAAKRAAAAAAALESEQEEEKKEQPQQKKQRAGSAAADEFAPEMDAQECPCCKEEFTAAPTHRKDHTPRLLPCGTRVELHEICTQCAVEQLEKSVCPVHE
jgi:DNA-nicking Smr family endonuclease